jgi:F0F1-type ATP synthase assembly protein I
MIEEHENDWDEAESPRGISGLEAGADVLAAVLMGAALGWIVYMFGF